MSANCDSFLDLVPNYFENSFEVQVDTKFEMSHELLVRDESDMVRRGKAQMILTLLKEFGMKL